MAVKTNVMRALDQAGIEHKEYFYETGGQAVSGVEVASMLGLDEKKVFKTLVTEGASRKNYVFVIPVAEELDLKKAAKAVGEKSIAMIKSKDLLSLTGYVHGGCSPIGMKKPFTTLVHESCLGIDTMIFSAGKIGYQVELAPKDLISLISCATGDLIKE